MRPRWEARTLAKSYIFEQHVSGYLERSTSKVHELATGTYTNKYTNDIFAEVANALCRNGLAV